MTPKQFLIVTMLILILLLLCQVHRDIVLHIEDSLVKKGYYRVGHHDSGNQTE
ncbi:hypothetical protein DPMN_042141 [Dreissena polymorpha]|uniref:Uncharacterized protein n=1 Tax=Dreissena polymorpha TaxID=45954 RepID=A0A9D4D097_DREPO|nr:hypothetical protein DPMN_042141 [Dreissena polymorpha]